MPYGKHSRCKISGVVWFDNNVHCSNNDTADGHQANVILSESETEGNFVDPLSQRQHWLSDTATDEAARQCWHGSEGSSLTTTSTMPYGDVTIHRRIWNHLFWCLRHSSSAMKVAMTMSDMNLALS